MREFIIESVMFLLKLKAAELSWVMALTGLLFIVGLLNILYDKSKF